MAQVINGSAEIAINAMRGFIGDEFTVRCSSVPVRPGTRLSIHWSTLEGSSTNPPVSVGECHSVRAGFPGMVCSPGVDIIEPYTDGVTDFAVSSIVHQVRVKPTRIRCQPGNGETLAVEPLLSVRPEIEDLHIACYNEQTRLEWLHRGEADHLKWIQVMEHGKPYQTIIFHFLHASALSRCLKSGRLMSTERDSTRRSIQILAFFIKIATPL